MKFYGVTDNKWFEYLAQLQPDEVNFYSRENVSFKAIPQYAPFLLNCIAPMTILWVAVFVRHSFSLFPGLG